MGHRPELRPHDAGAAGGRRRLGRRARPPRRSASPNSRRGPNTTSASSPTNAVGTTLRRRSAVRVRIPPFPKLKTEARQRNHPNRRPAQRLLRRQRRRHPLLLRMGHRPELRPHDDGAAGGRRRLGRRARPPLSANLSELTPQTEYHFRVVATNAVGTTFGDDQQLRHAARRRRGDNRSRRRMSCRDQRPAQRLLRRQRRRHPLLLRMGHRPELRPHDDGATGRRRRLGSRADSGQHSTSSGINPITTYHFRLVATNAVGTTYGPDEASRRRRRRRSSASRSPMCIPKARPLHAQINPGGGDTKYRFEYATEPNTNRAKPTATAFRLRTVSSVAARPTVAVAEHLAGPHAGDHLPLAGRRHQCHRDDRRPGPHLQDVPLRPRARRLLRQRPCSPADGGGAAPRLPGLRARLRRQHRRL